MAMSRLVNAWFDTTQICLIISWAAKAAAPNDAASFVANMSVLMARRLLMDNNTPCRSMGATSVNVGYRAMSDMFRYPCLMEML